MTIHTLPIEQNNREASVIASIAARADLSRTGAVGALSPQDDIDLTSVNGAAQLSTGSSNQIPIWQEEERFFRAWDEPRQEVKLIGDEARTGAR